MKQGQQKDGKKGRKEWVGDKEKTRKKENKIKYFFSLQQMYKANFQFSKVNYN